MNENDRAVVKSSVRSPSLGLHVRSVGLGLVMGFDAAGHCIALASLCFAGALAAGLAIGTGSFLLASAFATLVLTFFGGFRVTFGIAQDTSISILAPAVLATGLAVQAGVEAQVVTAVAMIGTSAVLSGVVFWLVGALGLGRFVRLLPYPVAAGFLASSGYLLIAAAFSLLAPEIHDLGPSAIFAPEVHRSLLPAIALAVVLFYSVKKFQSPLPVLIALAVAIAAFYGVLSSLGLALEDARALALIPDLSNGADLSFLNLSPGQIDWPLVAVAAPTIAAVILINLLAILLNISGVELALHSDIDVNREMRTNGLINIVAGGAGSVAAFIQGGGTILAAKLGAERIPLGLSYAGVLLLVYAFSNEVVALVPTFAAAGLLVFIGLSMLDDWLIHMRRRLVAADWIIIVGIVAVTAIAGILPAIAIGLLLALLSFAVEYARLPVIRGHADGFTRRSVVDRCAVAEEVLAGRGQAIQILHLQGALFFGSIERLKVQIVDLSVSVPELRYLMLDFSEVNTVDSAACAALGKLREIAAAKSITLVFTNMSAAQKAVLDKWGLKIEEGLEGPQSGIRFFSNLDDALEACEDVLVADAIGAQTALSITEILASFSDDDTRIGDLVQRMDRIDLLDGEILIRRGAESSDLFFLESGRLLVRLATPEGKEIRVRSMTPGAIVGELGYLLRTPRTADVLAEGPCVVWRLDPEAMRDIETNEPALAALLNGILARSLSMKVMNTNNLLTNFQSNRNFLLDRNS